MAQTVSEFEVRGTLNDRGIMSGLSKTEREVRAATKRMDGLRAQVEIDADIKGLKAKEKEALATVKRLEASRAEVAITGDSSDLDREIIAARAKLKGIGDEKIKLKVERSAVQSAERDFIRLSKAAKGFGQAADESRTIFGRWLNTLSNTTVRIGPFTASIRAVGAAIGTLGPVIVSLVGALGSLISVAGTGLAGGLTVGAGAALGFGQAALGVGLILKPLIGQFGSAMKASKAYNQAVLQYGKNSKQAATAQDKLNSVLNGVDGNTKKAFQSVGKLRTEWQHLTSGAKPQFFNAIGQGIKTATALMPQFAARSTRAFGIVSRGVGAIFKDLRAGPQKGALDEIFGNFNKTLAPALSGVKSLINVFIRLGQIGSRVLPSMGKGFQDWAQGLEKASRTSAFETKVRSFIGDFQALGRFAMAAGRLISTVFQGGASAGRGFLNTMTAAMNRWTAFLNTTKGQDSLQNFFKGSVDTTQQLFAALAPLASAFLRIMAALRPISNAVLQFATHIADLINWLTKIPGASSVITGLGAVIAVGFTIGPILRFAGAIRTVIATLAALRGATIATGISGLVTGMVGASTAAAGLEGATVMTGVSLTELGASAAAVAAPLAAIVLPASAAALAIMEIVGGTHSFSKTVKPMYQFIGGLVNAARASRDLSGTTQQMRGELEQLAPAHLAVQRAALQEKQAEQTVNALRKQGKTGTQEYKQAILDLRDARLQQHQAQLDEQKTLDAYDQRLRRLHTDEDALRAAAAKSQAGSANRAALQTRLNTALNAEAALNVNRKRALAGLAPTLASAQQQVGQFARSFGKVKGFQKLVVQTDDAQAAGKLASLGNKASKLGGTKSVIRILGDSKNAEEAIRRLNSEVTRLTAKRALVHIDTNAPAVGNKLAGIGAKLSGLHTKKTEPKVQLRDRATGPANSITGAIGRIPIRRNVNVTAGVGQALGAIGSVIGMLNSIPGSKGIAIQASAGAALGAIGRAAAHKPKHHKHATGGATDADQRAYERAAAKGPPKRNTGRVVTGPTLLTGEENRREYVIATNPAYKRRNRHFVESAAVDLGGQAVFPAKAGFAPPALKKQPSVGQLRRGKLPPTIERMTGYGSQVAGIQRTIGTKEGEFSRLGDQYSREIKDPKFTTKTGDYTPAGVERRQNQLEDLAQKKESIGKLYEDLQKLVQRVKAWVDAQINRMQAALKGMKNQITVGSGKHKHKVENKKKSALKSLLSDYENARATLVSDSDSAGNSHDDALNEAANLRSESSGVAVPTAEPDTTSLSDVAIAAGEAALGQAQLTPDTGDDAAAYRQIIDAEQTKLNEAQAVLSDPFSTNAQRLQAYNDISSATGAIKGAQDSLGGLTSSTGTPSAADVAGFSTGRSDLYKTFGSNFVGSLGRGFPTASMVGPYARGTSASGGAPGGMPGAPQINIQQTFAGPPEDPHTWSQGIAWDLQAAV